MTGSGKTTQVPQFILENYTGQGTPRTITSTPHTSTTSTHFILTSTPHTFTTSTPHILITPSPPPPPLTSPTSHHHLHPSHPHITPSPLPITEHTVGATCNIIVTQPRRISAISIAERVSAERGEPLGRTVGYQVRLDSMIPQKPGRILFCTTGILLMRMRKNPFLHGEG